MSEILAVVAGAAVGVAVFVYGMWVGRTGKLVPEHLPKAVRGGRRV